MRWSDGARLGRWVLWGSARRDLVQLLAAAKYGAALQGAGGGACRELADLLWWGRLDDTDSITYSDVLAMCMA